MPTCPTYMTITSSRQGARIPATGLLHVPIGTRLVDHMDPPQRSVVLKARIPKSYKVFFHCCKRDFQPLPILGTVVYKQLNYYVKVLPKSPSGSGRRNSEWGEGRTGGKPGRRIGCLRDQPRTGIFSLPYPYKKQRTQHACVLLSRLQEGLVSAKMKQSFGNQPERTGLTCVVRIIVGTPGRFR